MKLVREINNGKKISCAKDFKFYLKEFENEDREHFIVIGLDTQNRVCYREVVSIGILNASIVHPREIFKKAIINSCDKIVIAHNHPSGDTTPSYEDLDITKKLIEAGEILGITVLDSLIIGKDKIESYAENKENTKWSL